MTEPIEKICPACGSGTSFKVGHHAAWCENCAFECAACFWDQLSKQRQELEDHKKTLKVERKAVDEYFGKFRKLEQENQQFKEINELLLNDYTELHADYDQLKAKLAKYEAMKCNSCLKD